MKETKMGNCVRAHISYTAAQEISIKFGFRIDTKICKTNNYFLYSPL